VHRKVGDFFIHRESIVRGRDELFSEAAEQQTKWNRIRDKKSSLEKKKR
jgi:hypothetical protein